MSIQTTWKDVVERWNSVEIQSLLIEPLKYVTDERYKPVPYAGQFFSLIFAFASTIYYHTYSYDNLTRAFYTAYANKMPHTYDASPEQQQLFKEILEKMPNGFKDYAITCGYLSFPEGTNLSVRKANEFLDFIVSDTFNDIMTQIQIE